MKKIVLIITGVVFFSCATLGTMSTPSFHTKIRKEDSETAWSRTHAYLSRRMCRRSYFPEKMTVLKSSNKYVIEAEDVFVTREFERDYVRIRITRPVIIRKDINGKISEESKKELTEAKTFIYDMLRYITSGHSRYMDDEDIQDKNGLTEH
ncbi:MAG TPA: hypothetical protein PLT75_02065 [Spirochaetota bacterium]|nr:hypothetical protein [Spirochaetota bacterium]